MKYTLSQIAIFFSVFTIFSFIDINYNGFSWEYSLAYGSLIPLAAWRFRHDTKVLICIAAVAAYWTFGRGMEIFLINDTATEAARSAIAVRLAIALTLILIACERWTMVIMGSLIIAYSVRLSALDPTFYQQGLLNLMTASLFFIPLIKVARDDKAQEFKEAEQYHEAA